MKFWNYINVCEEKFKDYHFSSMNNPEFTSSQIYYEIDKEQLNISDSINEFKIINEPKKDNIFEKVIFNRKSCPETLDNLIEFDEKLISKFCKVAFIGDRESYRNYPSGGGLYNVNIFFIFNINKSELSELDKGNIAYLDCVNEKLVFYKKKLWRDVEQAFVQKQLFESAKCAVILSVDFNNISRKYTDIAYKLIQQEAGHIGQNIQLVSEYLGIKSIPLQGFYDIELTEIIENNQVILYSFLLG